MKSEQLRSRRFRVVPMSPGPKLLTHQNPVTSGKVLGNKERTIKSMNTNLLHLPAHCHQGRMRPSESGSIGRASPPAPKSRRQSELARARQCTPDPIIFERKRKSSNCKMPESKILVYFLMYPYTSMVRRF